MRDQHLDVVVAIPSNGAWVAATGKSVALLFSYFGNHRIGNVKSQKLAILTVESSVIVANRHILLKKACLEKQRTHILFLDADMEFPMNTLHRLLAHDKDVIAANCTTRVEPILPVAFGFDDERIHSRGKKGIQRVRQVGAAVMLIRLDCVRRLRPPFFMNEWVPEMQNYCGEDVYMCQLLQAAGVDVWIDHELSVDVKHYGMRAYGHGDIVDGHGAADTRGKEPRLSAEVGAN